MNKEIQYWLADNEIFNKTSFQKEINYFLNEGYFEMIMSYIFDPIIHSPQEIWKLRFPSIEIEPPYKNIRAFLQ